MADIDVVPKGKSHTWLWVLGIIALALILWAVMGMPGRTPQNGQLRQDSLPQIAADRDGAVVARAA
jgi:hypothetical protein